jgi:hypothetical protein
MDIGVQAGVRENNVRRDLTIHATKRTRCGAGDSERSGGGAIARTETTILAEFMHRRPCG